MAGDVAVLVSLRFAASRVSSKSRPSLDQGGQRLDCDTKNALEHREKILPFPRQIFHQVLLGLPTRALVVLAVGAERGPVRDSGVPRRRHMPASYRDCPRRP